MQLLLHGYPIKHQKQVIYVYFSTVIHSNTLNAQHNKMKIVVAEIQQTKPIENILFYFSHRQGVLC